MTESKHVEGKFRMVLLVFLALPWSLAGCGADGITVSFRAIAAGKAQIRGALPCRVPFCAAAAAIVSVVVTDG